ncbi:MAG: DnaT-like ssDNA-binding protein [Candidatus Limnocylindrus sp.]
MTVTITATAGASNANSYLTVAQADTLADDYLGTLKWSSATTDNKGRALIMATRYLDQLSWIGTRASTTQSLAWPRTDAECGEWSFLSTVIPDPIKQGCFDLAEALLTTPTLLTTAGPGNAELIPGIPNASLKSARVDVIAVDFRDGAVPSSRNALNVVPSLRQTLGCLCTSVPVGTGNVRVLRS